MPNRPQIVVLPNRIKSNNTIVITGRLGISTKTISQSYFLKILGNLGPPLLSEDLPSVIDVVLGDIGIYFLPDI